MTTLATRPSEIEFVEEGGLRGIVVRRTYLSEVTDYSIRIDEQKVRVQIGRHKRGPADGETCGLHFSQPFWYAEDEK